MKNHILHARFVQTISFLALTFWLFSLSTGNSWANVCSQGVGLPPFLSAGANPNLLLVLDNSGSMLDLAYLDQVCVEVDNNGDPVKDSNGDYNEVACIDHDEDGIYDLGLDTDTTGDGLFDTASTNAAIKSAECYDNGYLYSKESMAIDPTMQYEGYFDRDTWYVWSGSFQPWYETLSYGIEEWENGAIFAAESFAKVGQQLYFTQNGGTTNDPDSSNGFSIDDDNGVTDWVMVDWTWRPGTVYGAGALVSFQSMLFYTSAGGTSGTIDPWNDGFWARVDGGQFVPAPTDLAAKNVCTTAASGNGDEFTHTDLCIVQDSTTDPAAIAITAFAARGNFLNWAMSSKFDIQKKILTGGKYNDTVVLGGGLNGGFLVAENRGCAGSRFVKELTLDQNGSGGAPMVLTLGIRGFNDKDWLDTLDNTTRMEIFEITEGGASEQMGKCQEAVDVLMDPNSAPGHIYTPLEGCLGVSHTGPTIHATQECWQLSNAADPATYSINATNIYSDCNKIYDPAGGPRTYPWDINYYDDAYVCYGAYNSIAPWRFELNDDALFPQSNIGYVGRCWREWETNEAGVQCLPKPCPAPYVSGDSWKSTGIIYQCVAGSLQECVNYDNSSKICLEWEGLFEDPTGATCVPNAGSVSSILPSGVNLDCGGSVSKWMPTSPLSDGDVGYYDPWVCDNQKYNECVEEAIRDYCTGITVPEVIDPSDAPTQSDQTWNLPASFVDRGLQNFFGDPIAVIKGWIQYELPAEQTTDHVNEPDGPRGLLYDVADSLRIGAMAFNNVGSRTECDPNIVPPDAALKKHCPENNKDGAELVAMIDTTMYVHDNWTEDNVLDDFPVWGHYKNLVAAVNDVRATSWTPLAEAMFNAIGYYAQRTDMRLNADDFTTVAEIAAAATEWVPGTTTTYDPGDHVYYYKDPLDITSEKIYFVTVEGGTSNANATFPTNDDQVQWTPVAPQQYWCQSNHVLMITEGSSTQDINQTVSTFLNDPTMVPVSRAEPVDDGDSQCAVMNGSTYLDDLTYFAQYDPDVEKDDVLRLAAAEALYTPANAMLDGEIRGDITTHIVTSGSLRDTGTTDECNPKNLITNAATNGGTTAYSGENPTTLGPNLEAVFSNIMSRASAGSAASVISSSRSGSGAVYQAIFWPELQDAETNTTVEWVGDVHGLFLDKNGFLYEDTPDAFGNQDGMLTPSSDMNNNGICDGDEKCKVDAGGNPVIVGGNKVPVGHDRRVIFYFSELSNRSRACYNIDGFYSNNKQCPGDTPEGTECTGDCVELPRINYLWSASKWLSKVTDPNAQRTYDNTVSVDPYQRYIITWQDLNNNGIVDTGEQLDFTENLATVAGTNGRGTVADDFAFSTNQEIEAFVGDMTADKKQLAAKAVISWIRGKDQLNNETTDTNVNGRLDKQLRSRDYPFEKTYAADGTLSSYVLKTWRLGDVIHSTPTVVARPAEAFHFVYKDPTYATFADHYKNRRQVVYFGANDGMLHAINAGFYEEAANKFWKGFKTKAEYLSHRADSDPSNDTYYKDVGPDLGAELWAYVPYNLIPHLKCLADQNYDHKFYVDQRPKVFDVQIFQDDSGAANPVHPGGWGTILVGSMRFGGACVENPVKATDIGSTGATDNRTFISSYFILDITNPEQPPTVLAEMTSVVDGSGNPVNPDMGFTTPSPAMTVQRDTAGSTNWYLMLGNGPQTIQGKNFQPGKIAVVPLKWFTGEASWATVDGDYVPTSIDQSEKRPFRIPNSRPASGVDMGEGGFFEVPAGPSGADSFISDLITVDFDVEVQGVPGLGGLYRGDAVYFGTTDGNDFTSAPFSRWDGGGRMFRLVTKVLDAAGNEIASKPYDWAPQWSAAPSDPNNPIRLLIDAKAPITAAPSVGWDGKSFWVYFGSGRFFDKKDKTDPTMNRFFGIREPFDITSPLTCNDQRLFWPTLTWDLATDDLNDENATAGTMPGTRGLLQTDNMMVAEYASSMYDVPFLTCEYCIEDPDNLDGDDDGITCNPAHTGIDLDEPDCFPNYLLSNKRDVPNPQTADPTDTVSVVHFNDVRDYIAGTSCDTGIDGWFREVHEERERHLGQAALLGGLLTFTGYQPFEDVCKAEGKSFLYGVHYQTGTAWYENVFGTYGVDGQQYVKAKLSLGTGLATTPSLHVGAGANDAKAFVQTSTGEIIEIGQENLPLKNVKSGRIGWSDEIPD
ncbi:MAG: PilC/PilY family type IV pilus protein [Desulfobulbaceae bacterium]|nr:PilC/PilY family type IV pilus protein [Desulfobulbaceae bacterium]